MAIDVKMKNGASGSQFSLTFWIAPLFWQNDWIKHEPNYRQWSFCLCRLSGWQWLLPLL
jgi:hypothetical protein